MDTQSNSERKRGSTKRPAEDNVENETPAKKLKLSGVEKPKSPVNPANMNASATPFGMYAPKNEGRTARQAQVLRDLLSAAIELNK